MKKLTSPLESWLSRTEFRHSRSRSRAVTCGAKNNPLRNMTTRLYRERQLWSGNESVEIRYVNGSFVAGTSASSPGVPRPMEWGGVRPLFYIRQNKQSKLCVGKLIKQTHSRDCFWPKGGEKKNCLWTAKLPCGPLLPVFFPYYV